MKPGDHVECIHDAEWKTEHRQRDLDKAKRLGRTMFVGRAAAYLHLGEAYVVTEVTINGGVRLRGFTLTVSQDDLKLSDREPFR